jgi:hypothetical protein
MRVEQVTPDETSPVWGYERRTLRCPECGDVERRLAFAGDKGPPGPKPQSEDVTIEAPSSVPIAEVRPEASAPPDQAPAAKWAQAVEKVRMRRTILALQVAAQRTADATVGPSQVDAAVTPSHADTAMTPSHADTAATPSQPAHDDFDRIWDNLARPSQSPPLAKKAPLSRIEPATVTVMKASPSPEPRVVPLPSIKTPPATVTSAPPAVQATPAAPTKPHPFQGVWIRATGLLRGWQDRAKKVEDRAQKVEHSDAILRIDTDALRVMPRNKPASKTSPKLGRPR